MGKETFILRTEWAEDLELLDNDEKADLLEMLFDYAEGGENAVDPNASRAAKMVFKAWRRFIDYSDIRHEEVCRKNAENGKKGGAPKGNSNARKRKNPVEQNRENHESVQQDENNQNNRTVESLVSEQAITSETSLIDIDIDIESDIDIEDDSKISGGVISFTEKGGALRDPKLAQVVQYYQRKISPDMSRQTVEQLKLACEEWDAEVVIHAIDAAIDAGKRNGSYVCGILRGFRRDGIRTVEDALRKDEQHRLDREREQAQRKARQARHAPAQVLQPSGNGYLPADDLAYLFESAAGTPREGSP